MDRATQQQVIKDFRDRVTSSEDRVLNLSDQIHELSKKNYELTALCQFGRSMQVRRLLGVRPQSWNPTDFSNADAVVTSIDHHMKNSSEDAHVIALAVLGVEVEGLERALSKLGIEQAISNEIEKITLPEGQSGMNGDSNDTTDQSNKASKRTRRK